MRKALIILAAAIVILSGCVLYELINTHLWCRVHAVRIWIGNEYSPASHVFKSCDLNYLVVIRKCGRVRYYLVDPHAMDITIPNDNFVFVMGNIVSRFYPPNAAPYRKSDREPCLKIQGNVIEFMDITDKVTIEMAQEP